MIFLNDAILGKLFNMEFMENLNTCFEYTTTPCRNGSCETAHDANDLCKSLTGTFYNDMSGTVKPIFISSII